MASPVCLCSQKSKKGEERTCKIRSSIIEGLQEDQLIEELKSGGEEIFDYKYSVWYVSFFKEKWVAWELTGLEQEKLGKIKFFNTKFEAVIDQLKLGIRLLGKEDIHKYIFPCYIFALEVAKEIFGREFEGEEIDVFKERDILLDWLIYYSGLFGEEYQFNIIQEIPKSIRSAVILDFEEERKKKKPPTE